MGRSCGPQGEVLGAEAAFCRPHLEAAATATPLPQPVVYAGSACLHPEAARGWPVGAAALATATVEPWATSNKLRATSGG